MTERQLRDVLSRVVPEPPDSVADASPVVRVARRQRRVRVAGVSGLAAVLVAGTVVGALSVTGDERDRTVVADEPAISDPYTTAPCPEVSSTWPTGEVADLARVTAVRYCARDTGMGFGVAAGPLDALVTGIDAFGATLADGRDADPARCAAVDPIPTDSRLLFQLDDGSYVGVPAGICQDAEIGGHTLDGGDVTSLFLGALRFQRNDHRYAPPEAPAPSDCMASGISPAVPKGEHLVAAIACTGSGVLTAVGMADDETARLDEAWRTASMDAPNCTDAGLSPTTIIARTDRGDLVRLDPLGCGQFSYREYLVTFTYEDNTGGGS